MANFMITKAYDDTATMIATTDLVHADTINPLYEQLFNNGAFLYEVAKNRGRDIKVFHGAKMDGVTNDFPAFTAARTAVGAAGIVFIPSGTTYFAGSRPDLTGCYIAAAPDAVIKLDENPNTKELKLLTPVTFFSTADNVTVRKPANIDIEMDYLTVARNVVANAPTVAEKYNNLAWSNFTGVQIVAVGRTADTSHVIDGDKVYYPAGTTFTAGAVKCLVRPIKIGEYVEATFKKPNTTAVTKYIGIYATDGVTDMYLQHYPSDGVTRILTISQPGGGINYPKTFTTTNGNAYRLNNNGSLTMGIKNVDGTTAELYVNGKCVGNFTWSTYIKEMGFEIPNTDYAAYEIVNPCSIFNYKVLKPTTLAIGSFGDSITYGAWSAIEYPKILAELLRCTPSIGDVSYVNHAVSGQTSATQLAVMKGVNLAAYNYVTIMVGTNDCQGNVTAATLVANVASMVALVTAAGAVPIVGLFPVYSDSNVTGYGKDTGNYDMTAIYISELKKWCIANSVAIADVRAYFGDNIQWYADNIHPNEKGMVAIAAAFYNAILSSRQAKEKAVTFLNAARVVGTVNVVYGTAAPTTGTWAVGDEVVNNSPAELGVAASKYVIEKWKCTVAGSPGTWLPLRCLTGN